jgi:replicative DNA helicase
MRIEEQILSNLIHNEEYCRKVIPFINTSYFSDFKERMIVEEITAFFNKYNKPISSDILTIELSNRTDITDKQLADVITSVEGLPTDEANQDWLIEHTEKFCKDKAVYNAILESIKIIDGKDDKRTQESIPHILSDALAVSFDNHVGHDYLDDAQDRFDFYHRVEEKLEFDLDLFNKITKGGFSKKTLNVILAGTGVGKSLFMCHVAASTLMQGKNVLYITMEMAEERIAERIDANLLNLSMDELKVVDRKVFNTRLDKIARKTQGKLIVKEYPTAGAHSGHFRALLEELKIKKDFAPDLIVIDYLNICASARLKMGANVNSYTYVKTIAEELRGLAVEYNVPMLSATQTTRGGFDNTDVGLQDTSESFGLPATVDFMCALISTEELEEMNQLMVKQLKNRYNDPSYFKRFVIGVDRSKMKLYNVEVSAQNNISDSGQDRDDGPAFDKTSSGGRIKSETFDGFKF